MSAPSELRFCWWNVQDFAHFDPSRAGQARWPTSADMHAEKFRRVVSAFDVMFGPDAPDLIGLCEITPPVAERLRLQRFPDHELALSEPADPDSFQVVILIRRERNLTRRASWVARDVTEETRPMGVVQFSTRLASILFVACHWPAMEKPSSRENRRRSAYRLRDGIYEFLHRRSSIVPRHVVVFGDFNSEPHDPLFAEVLSASRDRDHARRRLHRTDEAKLLTRLYNGGWRWFGEGHPHGPAEPSVRRVGSYYHADSGEWRTFDQVLATGRLLIAQPPYLDEGALLVRTDTGNLVDNKPAKFRFENGVVQGLSDHYPLTGRIVLG